MTKRFVQLVILITTSVCFALSMGCGKPWPESPLYEAPENDPGWTPPADQAAAKAALVGHYAHYDVVAYGPAPTPAGPMNTFIVSYGFTDLYMEGDDLREFDEFCHAEHIANQPFVSVFDDAATQAIEPRIATVNVFQEDEEWKVHRPKTPTLIGIDGDPDEPLSTDPNDPNINDDDGDGKPGVTVHLTLYGFLKGDLYIARREIFQSHLTLYSDGTLFGYVEDDSEQLVVGATLAFLNKQNNPPQYRGPLGIDYGLSPIFLVPIPEDMDTCQELMANRDALFPPEPTF